MGCVGSSTFEGMERQQTITTDKKPMGRVDQTILKGHIQAITDLNYTPSPLSRDENDEWLSSDIKLNTYITFRRYTITSNASVPDRLTSRPSLLCLPSDSLPTINENNPSQS
eukprot:489893_1